MQAKELPFYLRFSGKLLMILLLCIFIRLGQTVIIPLIYSILLSILLLPLTNFLQHKFYFSRSLANLTAIFLSLALIVALIYFFSHQIAGFLQDIPTIKEHLHQHYLTLQHWVQEKFNISLSQQTALFDNAARNVKSSGGQVIGQTFFRITETFVYIIMVAIYTFLILFYRHLIKRFLFMLFKKEGETGVTEVLSASKSVIQKYMLGLVIEMGIVAVLNTGVLLVIGVKYAIFLGIFSAILNIIPYIGILLGLGFTLLVTLSTSTHLSELVWIVIGFEVIHFADSNFLMPRIVGSKVKINALVTIVGVVIAGSLVGLAGIFLALPIIAILKIIFDRVEELKPWGMMMGDETAPTSLPLKKRFRSVTFKRNKRTVENPASGEFKAG